MNKKKKMTINRDYRLYRGIDSIEQAVGVNKHTVYNNIHRHREWTASYHNGTSSIWMAIYYFIVSHFNGAIWGFIHTWHLGNILAEWKVKIRKKISKNTQSKCNIVSDGAKNTDEANKSTNENLFMLLILLKPIWNMSDVWKTGFGFFLPIAYAF